MKRAGVIAIVVLLVLYIGISFFFSGQIIESNGNEWSASNEQEAIAESGMTGIPDPEYVSVTAEDGVTLTGSFYEHPAGTDCAVLLLHGRGGTRTSMIRIAPLFWDIDCHFLTYDLRAAGDSDGDYQTYGYYDRTDASLMIDWVSERTDLPTSNIGLMGVSYGAAVSLQTLAVRNDIGFVIADSSFSSLSDIVVFQGVERFGSWVRLFIPGAIGIAGIRANFNVSDSAPVDTVVGSDVPTLLIHALEDEFTPATHSELIFENSNQETTVLEITDWGGGHVSSYFDDPDGYATFVHEFLEVHVPSINP